MLTKYLISLNVGTLNWGFSFLSSIPFTRTFMVWCFSTCEILSVTCLVQIHIHADTSYVNGIFCMLQEGSTLKSAGLFLQQQLQMKCKIFNYVKFIVWGLCGYLLSSGVSLSWHGEHLNQPLAKSPAVEEQLSITHIQLYHCLRASAFGIFTC
jgi:hypothetical protein